MADGGHLHLAKAAASALLELTSAFGRLFDTCFATKPRASCTSPGRTLDWMVGRAKACGSCGGRGAWRSALIVRRTLPGSSHTDQDPSSQRLFDGAVQSREPRSTSSARSMRSCCTAMPKARNLTPLEPRQFFASDWSGEGEWIVPRWLTRLSGRARRFRFTSTTTWLSDEVWLVHDTTIWEDGSVEHRDGTARLVAPDRICLTYDDILGGTEFQLRADGFSFSPYRILIAVPSLPIPILVRAHDDCRWDATTGELTDVIELRILSIPVGRLVMHMRPVEDARNETAISRSESVGI